MNFHRLSEAIAEKNGYHKTLTGELAPIEWQRGNQQLVIDYCKNDVLIEAETLKRLLNGTLIDPNDGQLLQYSEWNLLDERNFSHRTR